MYIANVLQPLIDVCQAILEFWHNLIDENDNLDGSWGIAIILMTFTVRLAILPLTFKGVKSMQRLQTLQPAIKQIQERYKDDKQRMNQEVMAFYQREKVNPLGSCFPLLLQIPFFISLFYLLRSDEFQADIADNPGFLAIDNLAEKVTDPVLLGVLIVLYIGTQLAASAVTAHQRRPDAAPDHVRAAVRLRHLHRQLRGGPDPLLDHHERMDDRPAAAREEALSEAGAARPAGRGARAEARARETGGRGRALTDGGSAKAKPAAKAEGQGAGLGRRERRDGQGAARLPAQEEEALGAPALRRGPRCP